MSSSVPEEHPNISIAVLVSPAFKALSASLLTASATAINSGGV